MTGINPEHELHTRRRGRNRAVGLTLAALVALTFAVTIVKLKIPQSDDPSAPNYVLPTSASE